MRTNRIEGQYPSPGRAATIFEAFIRGEIARDEVLPRLHAPSSQALTFARLYVTRRINPQEQARSDHHEALEIAETDYVRNRLWDFTFRARPVRPI